MKHFKVAFLALILIMALALPAFAMKVSSAGTSLGQVTDLNTTGGITATVSDDTATFSASLRSATDAVASGQTSKAVTVSGVTTASKCVASINETTTNAVYVRGVVPTADTVTVAVSGDPGASNADISVICVGP